DRIVRPPVVSEILQRAEAAGSEIVAIDAIKLIESGLADRCDEVWVVTCDPETQLARLMARNRLDHEGAERRIAAQSSVTDKLARADRVIDNGGSPEETRRLVEIALRAAVDAHAGRGRKIEPRHRDDGRDSSFG
ncbi:MAG TPA: dephospho-CoA kinase, partial [Thermomicrobiales bacterium]|nr:dephospho-CoA kinase [Thermomicrobiales bacterium]